MNSKIYDCLNEQINAEFNASYVYLGMSAWCERRAFKGSAVWLRLQSQEEHEHGMKLYHFLLARDCQIELERIDKPPTEYQSLVGVFEHAYAHEREVTAKINSLYERAIEEKAFATLVELQWFLTEQVEEERSCREIVRQLQMVKEDPSAILDLDRQLGQRATS